MSLQKMSFESYTREQALGTRTSSVIKYEVEPNPEPTITTTTICCCVGEDPQTVIDDLEKRGEQVTKQVISDKTLSITNAGEKLLNVMSSGFDEFEKRTGRKMTYAEMRAAWG